MSRRLNRDEVVYGNLDARGGRTVSGTTETHYVVAAGTFTTAGGDAAESIPVTGITASDIAVCQLATEGSTPVTLDAAIATTNAITVTMSADPSTDHVISYVVYRAI